MSPPHNCSLISQNSHAITRVWHLSNDVHLDAADVVRWFHSFTERLATGASKNSQANRWLDASGGA